jgi:hypothetical protein
MGVVIVVVIVDKNKKIAEKKNLPMTQEMLTTSLGPFCCCVPAATAAVSIDLVAWWLETKVRVVVKFCRRVD